MKTRRFRPSVTVGWALITVTLIRPGPAAAETLEDALAQAYSRNAQLQGERARLRATDDYVPEALAAWRPQVSVTGGQGIDHITSKQDCGKAQASAFFGVDCSQKALNTLTNLWPQSYALTVQQALYDGGHTVAQTDQALDQVKSERATLTQTEGSVFASVVSDYANVVVQDSALNLAMDYERALRHEVDLTEQRRSRGELTQTDLAQAEAALAEASAARRSTEVQLAAYRAAYAHDVGDYPGKLQPVADFKALPKTLEDSQAQALRDNPAVIAADYAMEAARDNVRIVDSQGLPNLSLQGSIGRSKEADVSGLRTDTIQAAAQLNIPLYEGGAIAAQSHQAKQQVAIAQQQLDDARRTAVQAAAQSWAQLEGARDLIRLYRTEVAADERALEGVKQESRVGARTVYDILVQDQALFQARVSLVQARGTEIIAQADLLQSVGRLNAQDLGLSVIYYDPLANFERVKAPAGPFEARQVVQPRPPWPLYVGKESESDAAAIP